MQQDKLKSKPLEILRAYWGHRDFRSSQESIIGEVLDKRDVLAILPTGSGKSLCYQLPTLVTGGICLVISPLIALMQDQVEGLQRRGIKALRLKGGISEKKTVIAFDNLRHAGYKFIFLSPEKLLSEFIREKLKQLPLSLIAIDEAHCISQWGHDFRPSYGKLAELKVLFPEVPRIALTATATPRVEKDILRELEFDRPVVFREPVQRENLSIGLVESENIHQKLLQIVTKRKATSIAYVATRKESIVYSDFLNTQGLTASYYHGGLDAETKNEVLSGWTKEKTQVVVATNAFGMGIDKDNVRNVIHCHVPLSLESYVQEIGRAGRDGSDSYAYLVHSEASIEAARSMIERSEADSTLCRSVYRRLHDFFRIGQGETNDDKHLLDLDGFCETYGFDVAKTRTALGHLERNQVIEYTSHPNHNSRVRIVEGHERLLQRSGSHDPEGILLQALLRNYGGITEQRISVRESFIANRLGVSKSEVIQGLTLLDKDRYLDYEPSLGSDQIRFLVPREENFVFSRIKDRIDSVNRVKRNQFAAVVDFINERNTCRSVQLSQHFGEENLEDCGRCDVCRKREFQKKYSTDDDLAEGIFELLQIHQGLDIHELQRRLPLDKSRLLNTLEWMMEINRIKLNLNQEFELVK